MEENLRFMLKECSGGKYSALRTSCQQAIDLLGDPVRCSHLEAHSLREKCLLPVRLALESSNGKLSCFAVNALQAIVRDERFQAAIESPHEDQWLPMQVIEAVSSVPKLPDEIQIQVMKVLLNMTFSTVWCMNAKVILSISEVCVDVYNGSSSLRTAVQATFTQLLTSISERLTQAQSMPSTPDDNDALSDFSPSTDSSAVCDSLAQDVITILQFLCNKIAATEKPGHSQEVLPLLLEGVHAILKNIPDSISEKQEFTDLIWQKLCPSLIWLLGNPSGDRGIVSQKTGANEEIGRGAGSSSSAPRIIGPAAKTVYNIAVQLVRLVGSISSLRPVLQSVFHRILLYPPPQHRLEALKSVKELLASPDMLYRIAGPTIDQGSRDKKYNTATSDMALLRLMVDSMQECCLCNDSAVCTVSVTCIDLLLKSVEQICHGEGLTVQQTNQLLSHYNLMDQSPTTSSSNVGLITGRDKTDTDHTDTRDTSKTASMTCNGSSSSSSRVERRRQNERRSARQFVHRLSETLPRLLEMFTGTDVDETLQQLASDFCTESEQGRSVDTPSCEVIILNADGVYVTAYYALLLNLKLIQENYYVSPRQPVVSESRFIDDILGSGLLLYVSTDWLSEVYKQVLSNNLLETAGFNIQDGEGLPLRTLVTDVDGLGSRKIGGQLLADSGFPELSDLVKTSEAGLRFARQILVTCWEGILDVLCVLLSDRSPCGITMSLALLLGTDSAKEEALRGRQAVCTSLDGLQRTARLTCTLGMQYRCGAIFDHLSNASCVTEDLRPSSPVLERKLGKTPLLQNKTKPVRLHTACVLSLDTVLSTGLEMSSHSPDCWKHVFRCCAYVSQLEHMCLSREKCQAVTLSKYQTDMTVTGAEDQGDLDVMMPLSAPVQPLITPVLNVADFVNESSLAAGWESTTLGGGVLSVSQTDKVLAGLSQYIDRLFEDAASRLNLQALVSFLTSLCASSRQQLFTVPSSPLDGSGDTHSSNVLHLYRLADVLLRVVNSDRPLLHIMRVWSAVSSHLVEASCHRDRVISKKAISCMHECVTSLLSHRPELSHFHLNEFLCKPFENLLCLELCDGDVQDQIVCSICELVEGCSSEIRSGWRPLFAALRCVKIEYTACEEVNDARQRHVAAVLDVFEVFLSTDNVLVFANAAMDCVLCLLKYVSGTGDCDDSSDSDSDSGSDLHPLDTSTENLCLPALKYLHRCCTILSHMWAMPACPVFSGANRLQLSEISKCVDPRIPNMDINKFKEVFRPVSATPPSDGSRAAVPQPDTPPVDEHEPDIPALSSVPFHPVNRVASLRAEDEPHDTHSVDSGLGISGQQEHTDQSVDKPTPSRNTATVPVTVPVTVTEATTTAIETATEKSDATLLVTPDASGSDGDNPDGVDRTYYKAVTLSEIDNHTGILKIWFLIVEGLANTVVSAQKNYQSQTVDTLFELLSEASKAKDCVFSLYCMNHLILPLLQTWLRRNSGSWDHSLPNFKQYCGLCTDLAVEYLVKFVGVPGPTQNSLQFMLQQLFDVLVECVAQATESVSRLGCACIRHTLLSAGPLFTDSMWTIACQSISKACDLTLYPISQLLTLYEAFSDNFYGDVGQVKVAARRDVSGVECHRTTQLALQVFLLDSQRTSCPLLTSDPDDLRSYVFLLYPPQAEHSSEPDQFLVRVPFSNIVVGLLAHQLLLQTVGSVLLQGATHTTPEEQHILPSSPTEEHKLDFDGSDVETLPGMLRQLSTSNTHQLLACLQQSYAFSCDFDCRPGLKFLIQKVIGTNVSANLYKQAGVSMTFYIHTLLELCARHRDLTADTVRQMLSKPELGAGDVAPSIEDREVAPSIEVNGQKVAPSIEGEGTEVVPSSVDKGDHKTNGLNQKIEDTDALQFMKQLRTGCDALCQKYVDLLYDKYGETSSADRISSQPLFLLVAQPEDIPQLKRDKQIKDMVKEKLDKQRGEELVAMTTAAVNQQDDVAHLDSDIASEVLPPGGQDENHREEVSKHKKDSTKVYNIATARKFLSPRKTIHNLMMEYKKRKQVRAMPSFVKASRQMKTSGSKVKSQPSSVDPQIEQQQKDSITRDANAHIQSWTEMLRTLLKLLQQLSDAQFHTLLPVVFPCNNQLICHARDPKLKELLANWMYRVGGVFDMVPT